MRSRDKIANAITTKIWTFTKYLRYMNGVFDFLFGNLLMNPVVKLWVIINLNRSYHLQVPPLSRRDDRHISAKGFPKIQTPLIHGTVRL